LKDIITQLCTALYTDIISNKANLVCDAMHTHTQT